VFRPDAHGDKDGDGFGKSVCEGAEASSFTANIAVNKLRIHRNREYQLVLWVSWGTGED
jgi:hypothetical protein